MPYAQIDVSAPRHRKVWSLSDPAFRLWVSGLCYCQEHLTDGVLHRTVVASLAPRVRPAHIEELVTAGLWERDPDNGWRVHDYLSWNSSRAKVDMQRIQARARVERWRAKKDETKEVSVPVSNAYQNASVTQPIRSDPLRSTDQDQERKSTRLAAGPHPRVRTTDPTEPPKPALLAKIASEILKLDPTLSGADLKEAVKAQAARLRVAYDSDSVRVALDGAQAAKQRRSG